MSDPEKKPRRWRLWLKRLGWVLLGLFVLFIIFHRPIIFEGTRYFVVRAAKQQNLDLTYDIKGSIFSTLTVSQLKAVPTEPGPIQRLEVGTINLQYSLWGLLRKGLPALLQTVEIKDAFVEITPGEEPPPEKKEEPQSFKFPALFPETLRIENINFLSHSPGGNTEIANLYFTLLPHSPGVFKIHILDIPGVRRWEDISAGTTFRDRNLLLTDLVIGPEIALKTLNLNASELEDARLGVGLEGQFFGAATTLKLKVEDLNASNRLDLQLDCVGLSFDALNDYLHLNLPVSGTLTQLSVAFRGEPEKPRAWAGRINLRLDGLVASGQKLGALTFNTDIVDGKARSAGLLALDEINRAELTIDANLPEKTEDFVDSAITGSIKATFPDLGVLTEDQPQPLSGSATAGLAFQMQSGQLTASAQIQSPTLATGNIDLTETDLTLKFAKDLKSNGAPFRGLTSELTATIKSARLQEYTVDNIALALASKEADIQLTNLSLNKGPNTLALSGTYTLPEDMQSWQKQPAQVSVAIDAPELEAFALAGQDVLRGQLKVTGQATAKDGLYNGDFLIDGGDIRSAGLTIRTVAGQLAIVDNQAKLSKLDLVLDDRNAIHAQADVSLDEPYSYNGALDVRLSDLSVFRPLLGPTGQAPELAGSLVIDWKGSGNLRSIENAGSGTVSLTKGRFGDIRDITSQIAANYTPQEIAIPTVRFDSSLGSAELALHWKENRLSLSNLTVRQKQMVVLSGSADLPLILAQLPDANRALPADQPLTVALRTDDFDLATLFTQLGQKPVPLTGTVNLQVDARGTLDTLEATLALRATRLQSPSAATFAPADLSLDANIRNDRLSVDGTVRQALIQPLRITGDLPFDLQKIKENQAIDQSTPVNLAISLPRSSLDFLSSLAPAIRQSRGHATVDVRVTGTVGQPNLSGRVDADLSVLRFTDPSLPPVNNFNLALAFARERLTIERCRGGVAGGTFGVGGNIVFTSLDNPTFNLSITSRNALALQNDDMTARFSSDLRLDGPLDAASVSGTVWVTRSRFFKNIDILPIGLPGRPAPQPPAEPTIVSFPKPPLRDWKFNVAIKTADPFLVQSNLANGTIVIDLKLGGTGAEPWLDGSIRIEQLRASLPFSRLDVANSLIYFNRAQPFLPQLDIRGTSTIRDYDVQVNVYGPVTNPQAVFSSDPPLPQSDIVSLIATGMTTNELGRDPNALAGRAAILLFQKAYNSIFRRNRPPAEPSNSFLSRIQFDVGTTDPQTGKQATSIRIPLSDQIALVGGLDIGGNFRGQVKYLIRFQ